MSGLIVWPSKQRQRARVGETEEAASVIVFLASAAANYVTGNSINIDGGISRVL